VLAAMRAGADGCGENYAQEMLAKVGQLSEAGAGVQPPWHFVGRLQRNKVRQLAAHVAVWQSVDRVELGGEIARRAPGARVLVQCNISGESNKGGCAPEAVPGLVADLQAQGLDVAGVMGVAAAGDRSRIRREFEQLVAMADDLGLPERSIGMSGDYRDAVESGATMVRLGTVLFGSRA
jgi:pyridoxal phosphate enzyme (YggS family)